VGTSLEGGFGAMVQPTADILDRFSELWRADDATILKFAKTYGTLRRPLLLSGHRRKSDFEARDRCPSGGPLATRMGVARIAAALRSGDALTF